MNAPLSGKQKRENMKFLLDQLRDTAAFRKEQRRKDALAKQQMDHKEQSQQAKMANMGAVPPKMSKPTNPESGPNDKIPALLAPGEAVIPAKAAQKPENKPLIKALVREGRSDRNLSVPIPKGFMCGTEKVKGYQYGSPEVSPNNVGYHNAELSDSEGYGVLRGYEYGIEDVPPNYNDPAYIEYLNSQDNSKGIIPSIGNFFKDTFSKGAYEDVNKPIATEVPIVNKEISPAVPVDNTTVVSSPDTIAMRNNNPGNLRFGGVYDKDQGIYVDTGKYLEGQTGVDPKTGFAIFPDHDAGRAALEKQINLDTQTRGMTLESFITKYAPAADSNNPKAYAATIAKELGIKPTDKIPADKIGLVADVITRVESGGKYTANARQKEEENRGPVLLNDPNIVPEPEASKLDSVPQGGIAQQETYLKDIPKEGGTQQQQMLRDQTIPEDKTILGNYYDFGKETIVDGLTAIGNNIKDPKVLTNNLKSFVTDTLGFNGQDAAKFVSLYLAQRAMGVSERGASLFAGKYTLQNSDARAAREQAQISAMEQKGYVYDKQTKQFKPGALKPEGETKYKVVDGNTFAFRKFKEGGTGREEYYLEAPNGQRFTEAQIVGVFKDGDPKQIQAIKTLTSVPAEAYSSAQFGDAANAERRLKNQENLSKVVSKMQREMLGDPTDKKGNANPKYSQMPGADIMASQIQDTVEKYGLDMSKTKDQRDAQTALFQASEEAIRFAKDGKAKIEDVSFFFEQQMLLSGVGPTKELYKTKSGDAQPAEKVQNFKDVQKKLGGDRAQTISQFTTWANNFRTNKELQSQWEPSGTKSGFMRYVENEAKKIK